MINLLLTFEPSSPVHSPLYHKPRRECQEKNHFDYSLAPPPSFYLPNESETKPKFNPIKWRLFTTITIIKNKSTCSAFYN